MFYLVSSLEKIFDKIPKNVLTNPTISGFKNTCVNFQLVYNNTDKDYKLETDCDWLQINTVENVPSEFPCFEKEEERITFL